MLQAIGLTKKYGNFTALQDLNVSIQAGEIYCLLGANGAGKTTTIQLFLGFITPSAGKVLVKDIEVASKSIESKQYLAYIPENLTLYPHLTGIENLAYFAGLANKKHTQAQLKALLEEAGLQTDAHTKRVAHYSKGMRQKVGIALALAREAQALLLDEPTSGLDPQATHEFSNLLLRLQKKGVATLMATHDIFRAKQVATHIGIMKQGNLLKSFEAQQIDLPTLERLYLDTIQA
jgi:ABC-2 type transport system ATP-binding protein